MVNPDFNFFVGAEIIKGGDSGHKMVVDGTASTSDEDRQGETLYPIGFDFSPFMSYGLINYHHQVKNNPKAVIGEPLECKVTETGDFYVKGFLYPSNDLAVATYEQIQVFNNDSKTRRMGWSIEGKPLFKDPSNPTAILKALITNVAITPLPINGKSYAQIVKGFTGDESIHEIEDEKLKDSLIKNVNGGDEIIVDIMLAGGQYVKMSKGGKLYMNLDKALDSTAGRALIRESLEDERTGHVRSKEHILKGLLSSKKYTSVKELEEDYYKVLDKLQQNFISDGKQR